MESVIQGDEKQFVSQLNYCTHYNYYIIIYIIYFIIN